MIKPLALPIYADTTLERIEKQIEGGMKSLKDGESLKVEFLLPDGRCVIPNFIGFQNPGFITVKSKDESGNLIKLLLSHTNLNIIMTIVKERTEIRKPIGFQKESEESPVI